MKSPNCVTVDGSRSVDPLGAELTYKWELGDGTVKMGKVVDHCYSKPGKYRIRLHVIDIQTGIELKKPSADLGHY